MKRPRLNFNFHEHVAATFHVSFIKSLWIEFHCGNFDRELNAWMCVCVSRDCQCIFPSFSSLFRLVLDHRCRYATYSKRETKAEKAKPEIINKLNSIFMTLPAFELAESEKFTMWCDSAFHRPHSTMENFSVRHLMQKTLKEKRIFITKGSKKAFHVSRIFSPLKIRSLMKSYCYSIFI